MAQYGAKKFMAAWALPNDIKENRLHAPIDSYILQKLWNLKADGVTYSADTFYYKGNSWSKISDYDDYFDLQKVIRVMAKQGRKTVIEQEKRRGSRWQSRGKGAWLISVKRKE